MVPLELPPLEAKQSSSAPMADAVSHENDDLTEEEQKKLEAVGWRMLNLPLIVCHSANGMPFFFPLQKVHNHVIWHAVECLPMKDFLMCIDTMLYVCDQPQHLEQHLPSLPLSKQCSCDLLHVL